MLYVENINYGSYLTAQDEFSNFSCINENDFMDFVDTGDLILFRTSNTSSWFQRVWTKSHFDHVAMVLKYQSNFSDNNIFFFESVGDFGVRLVPWYEIRVHMGHFFDKVCMRKLNAKLNETQLKKLNQFRKDSVGKKYEIGITKMFRYESKVFDTILDLEPPLYTPEMIRKLEQQRRKEEQDRNFFCSELIAKAFKQMNMLSNKKKSCTQYYPRDFN